jgi:hypothetical protein
LVHMLNLQRSGSMTGTPILPLLQPKKWPTKANFF